MANRSGKDSKVTFKRSFISTDKFNDKFILEVQDGNIWIAIVLTEHEAKLLKLSIETETNIIIGAADCYVHSGIEGDTLSIGLSPAGFEIDNVVWGASDKQELLKMMEAV